MALVGDVLGAPRGCLQPVLTAVRAGAAGTAWNQWAATSRTCGPRRFAVMDVERLGDEVVRAGALRRTHVLVDRLVDESMSEAVPAGAAHVVDEDTGRQGWFEVFEERRTVDVQAESEHGEVERLALRGGAAERLDRRVRETGDALADDPFDLVWDRRIGRVTVDLTVPNRWMCCAGAR